MSFIYENQGTNTYLVYKLETDDELDTTGLRMLTNNSIPGIAEVRFSQVDSTKYIKYNVSAKVSASQLFSGPVNKKRLLGIFTGIITAMLAVEDYMLDTNEILLDLDYIFLDVSTCETVLICLPVANHEHKNPEIGQFFKNIVFNTQFDQTENCDHVAQILNYFNRIPALSLPDFKRLLDSMSIEKKPEKEVIKDNIEAPVKPEVKVIEEKPPVIIDKPKIIREERKPEIVTPVKPSEKAVRAVSLDDLGTGDLPSVPTPGEKQISLFYLLQHYNKENAAKYKAQQDAKKAQKNSDKEKKNTKQKTVPEKVAKPVNGGYAIPGMYNEAYNAGSGASGSESVLKPQQIVPRVEKQEYASVQQPGVNAVEKGVVQSIYFGHTTVLGDDKYEGTMVMGGPVEKPKVNPYLIRKKNNERIPLSKPSFRLGQEKGYADYAISDNPYISKGHAVINNRDGEFYVMDTNSTNRTYVDGNDIQSNKEVKLNHGAKIRLADEEFEFRLY